MPAQLPIYPSFSLVVTRAYLTAPLSPRWSIDPSPRYHPYPRPTRGVDDEFLTTVDYRRSDPPAVAFSPTPVIVAEDSDDESEESHIAAMNNLQTAVGDEPTPKQPRRRISLTSVVVDVALLLKHKCKTLVSVNRSSSLSPATVGTHWSISSSSSATLS